MELLALPLASLVVEVPRCLHHGDTWVLISRPVISNLSQRCVLLYQLTPLPFHDSSLHSCKRARVLLIQCALLPLEGAIHLQNPLPSSHKCHSIHLSPLPSLSFRPFSSSPIPPNLSHPSFPKRLSPKKEELPTHQSQQLPSRITRLRPNTQPILRPHRIKLNILKRFSLSFLWRLGDWIVCS